MMDQRFHAARNLPLGRRRDLRVRHAIGAGWHAIHGLIDNIQTLLHLQHTHQVAVVDIAIAAHRNIKIELLIAAIREGFAKSQTTLLPRSVGPLAP